MPKPKKQMPGTTESREQDVPARLTRTDPTAAPPYPQEALALENVAINGGWPPRVKGATHVKEIIPEGPVRPFTPHHEDQAFGVALEDSYVRSLLGKGRWEHLGTYLSSPRRYDERHHDVLLCLHNYSNGFTVEVRLRDGTVLAAEKKDSYYHPESAIEMTQAISLAGQDPRLKDKIAGLEASAILQIPPDDHPLFGHRLIWVMFAEPELPERESQTRYTAMVNINRQEVIEAGPCPCG